jgi:hypothetical protein
MTHDDEEEVSDTGTRDKIFRSTAGTMTTTPEPTFHALLPPAMAGGTLMVGIVCWLIYSRNRQNVSETV